MKIFLFFSLIMKPVLIKNTGVYMSRYTFLFLLVTFQITAAAADFITYIHPKPGSVKHNPETTIILKMPADRARTVSAGMFQVTGEHSGHHSGEVLVSDRTVIFKPQRLFELGESVSVRVDFSGPLLFDFSIKKYKVNVTLGMDHLSKHRPAKTEGLQKYAPVRQINGVAVPGDFPRIMTNVAGETAPGRIFISSTFFDNNSRNNYVFICDNDGTPYFYRRYGRSGLGSADFHKHPNGLLSFYIYIHGQDGYHVIMDHTFSEIDTFQAAHGYRTDNHEMLLLDNGHALLTAEDDHKVDMSQYVSGGKKNAVVQGNYVQEVDDKGNVYWEWRSWDHLEITDVDQINLKANYIDYVHLNSIAIDYDGHYILSLRNFSEVCKINSETGEFIWRLGGKKNQFDIDDDTRMGHQHCAKTVPGKPNNYVIFDNGNTRSPAFSRGVEYELDPENKTAQKVWEYRYSERNFTGYMGSVQRFSNGNTYLDWSAGPPMNGCEVDADNNLVFEIEAQGISSYRSRRYVWDGTMARPYLLLENMGTVIRLIFNKFGDETVGSYKVYYGKDKSGLALYGRTTETYLDFDAFILEDDTEYWFGVTAVNTEGNESELSNLENAQIRYIRPQENAVQNGGFENQSGWKLSRTGGARATGSIDDEGQYKVTISNAGSQMEHVELCQDGLLLMKGKDYVFEFDAYGSKNRAINAVVQSSDNRHTNYGSIGLTGIKTQKQHFKYTFPMQHNTDTDAQVVFQCGGHTGDVFIDNVSLIYFDIDGDLSPLPSPWKNRDIGMTAVEGLSGMRGNKFLVRASGHDIWYQSDEFHFVYRPITGDVEIIARVYAMDVTDAWAKAGVMVRETLKPESKHCMMVATGSNGAAFQFRSQTNGGSVHKAGSGLAVPYWVRLVRKNDEFTGYESTDGTSWTAVHRETVDMTEQIYVGLAVTAHNDGAVCEAQFENVAVYSDNAPVNGDVDFIPQKYQLYPAFPNPFNPQTVITFDLPHDGFARLKVYDVNGREVATLADKKYKAGRYEAVFKAGTYASGLYFYRLETRSGVLVKKMLYVK